MIKNPKYFYRRSLFAAKYATSSIRVGLTRSSSDGRHFYRSPFFESHRGEASSAAARPSFFTSWYWIGTLLAVLPEANRPSLLRGSIRGETVALALLGARLVRRRYGLIRSRALYLNETGDPAFDSLTIEHNGLLVAVAHETAARDALIAWFAGNGADADELHISGSADGTYREGG